MSPLLPPSFLFRYACPVHYEGSLPRRGTRLLGLPEEFSLPELGRLDDRPPFVIVRLAWNERGIGLHAVVTGKRLRRTSPSKALEGRMEVWFDTRCTQNVHRATRYCHHFGLFPSGGGAGGSQPMVRQYSIARAREASPQVDLAAIAMSSRAAARGYELEVWFPASSLNGFDPEANVKLGFFYRIRDSELGDQLLAMSNEFPVSDDPSLWVTLELVR